MRARRLARSAATPGPAERPCRLLPDEELRRRFAAALAAGAGEEGAHCIHEWWMRGEYPARIDQRLEELWGAAAASIPEWLPMRYFESLPTLYEVALRFSATRRGRCNLYLVLLDFEDRRRGPYGVYVGMTRYSPAQRFDQHKAGIHASGSVLRRGLEVLTGPVLHLQSIARPEALRLEAQLANALLDAGLLVEGGH